MFTALSSKNASNSESIRIWSMYLRTHLQKEIIYEMTINKVWLREQEVINKPKKCIWSCDEADVSLFLSGDDGHTMCVSKCDASYWSCSVKCATIAVCSCKLSLLQIVFSDVKLYIDTFNIFKSFNHIEPNLQKNYRIPTINPFKEHKENLSPLVPMREHGF